MDTYLYENLYHSSVRFFQHYAQNVNPRSQVRNRFQNIQLLQELADIYSLLLRFSCCKNFFSLSPQHYTKIHRLQLYLVYQQGFIEEHFQEPEKAPTETQKIKNGMLLSWELKKLHRTKHKEQHFTRRWLPIPSLWTGYSPRKNRPTHIRTLSKNLQWQLLFLSVWLPIRKEKTQQATSDKVAWNRKILPREIQRFSGIRFRQEQQRNLRSLL